MLEVLLAGFTFLNTAGLGVLIFRVGRWTQRVDSRLEVLERDVRELRVLRRTV